MLIKYSKQKGILNMLYTYNKDNYLNNFVFYSSHGNSGTRQTKDAFDWNNNTYWLANLTAPANNFVMFCFKKYFVKLSGIEVLTSSGSARPSKWSVGASNIIGTHAQIKAVDVEIGAGSTKYVEWSPGVYRCFSYINSGYSTRSDYTADIVQIEIFGELIERKGTCKNIYRRRNINVLFITVILFS